MASHLRDRIGGADIFGARLHPQHFEGSLETP
jgi:hypothetical protein